MTSMMSFAGTIMCLHADAYVPITLENSNMLRSRHLFKDQVAGAKSND